MAASDGKKETPRHTFSREEAKAGGLASKKKRMEMFASSVRFLTGLRTTDTMAANAGKLFADGELDAAVKERGEGLTAMEAMTAALIKEAYAGNVKAYKALHEISGEQPSMNDNDVEIVIDYDGLD